MYELNRICILASEEWLPLSAFEATISSFNYLKNCTLFLSSRDEVPAEMKLSWNTEA